jgi:hypothetical protein
LRRRYAVATRDPPNMDERQDKTYKMVKGLNKAENDTRKETYDIGGWLILK